MARNWRHTKVPLYVAFSTLKTLRRETELSMDQSNQSHWEGIEPDTGSAEQFFCAWLRTEKRALYVTHLVAADDTVRLRVHETKSMHRTELESDRRDRCEMGEKWLQALNICSHTSFISYRCSCQT
jgi:hypothetical protein